MVLDKKSKLISNLICCGSFIIKYTYNTYIKQKRNSLNTFWVYNKLEKYIPPCNKLHGKDMSQRFYTNIAWLNMYSSHGAPKRLNRSYDLCPVFAY